jgi:predicted nucleic acid-binding protein
MGQVIVRNLDDATIVALKARATMHGNFDRLAPTAPLSERALELAQRFNHPAYDCFYVALAEAESAVLVTDDDELIRLGKQARLAKWMKSLAKFESGSE